MRLRFVLVIVLMFLAQTVWALPNRIVSLKPNITEILFALGAGDRVVGVTKYCDYPERAKELPRVADYTRPFVEPIVSLKPDLVIGSREESSRKSILELEKIGITVAIFPFTTLDDTMSSIIGMSKLVGKEEEGKKIIKKMQANLDTIKRKWAGFPAKRVLAVVGRRPLIVFGHGTYMDELLSMVGAENVVPDGSVKYPRWSAENVIAADPEIIIDMSMGSELQKNEDAILTSWGGLTTVKAVREKRIYAFDISMFRQSPRIVESIYKLADQIHSL